MKHRRNCNILIGSMERMVLQEFPDMNIESYSSIWIPEVSWGLYSWTGGEVLGPSRRFLWDPGGTPSREAAWTTREIGVNVYVLPIRFHVLPWDPREIAWSSSPQKRIHAGNHNFSPRLSYLILLRHFCRSEGFHCDSPAFQCGSFASMRDVRAQKIRSSCHMLKSKTST